LPRRKRRRRRQAVLRLRSFGGPLRPRRTGPRPEGAVARPCPCLQGCGDQAIPRPGDWSRECVPGRVQPLEDNQHVVAYWGREPSILRFCA
jgi:hypothetical protein